MSNNEIEVHSESKSTELLGRMIGGGEKGTQLRQYRNALEQYGPTLEQALRGRIPKDHFIEVATTALMMNPWLLEAHPPSVFMAIRKAAQLNLRPDGEEGALIPYWNSDLKKKEAAFQPMYKGLVRTLLRTGMYRKVEARVARTGDEFYYELGLEPTIRHIPATSNRGDIEYAYAIVWMRGGGTQFEVMHIDELKEIRSEAKKRNNGREGPAWNTGYGEEQMYRKTPLKRLTKLLELDAEQAAVFTYDDQIDMGQFRAEPGDYLPGVEVRSIDERAKEHHTRQSKELEDRIRAQQVSPEEEVPAPQEHSNDAAPAVNSGGPHPADEPETFSLEDRIWFGKHQGRTWISMLEAGEGDRGYLTHFLLTPKFERDDIISRSYRVKLHRAVKAWDAETGYVPSTEREGAPESPEATEAAPAAPEGGLGATADRARRALDAVSGKMAPEQAVDWTNEIESLVQQGSEFGLRDIAEQLEKLAKKP